VPMHKLGNQIIYIYLFLLKKTWNGHCVICCEMSDSIYLAILVNFFDEKTVITNGGLSLLCSSS